MKKSACVLVAIVLGAGFTAGVLRLFGVQFAAGDVYPEYSSLRTDPAGAKLLFDALARVPGVTSARNYVPLDSFAENHAALLLLGLDPDSFAADSQMQLRAERLAGRGNRVILAMRPSRIPKVPRIGSLYRNWEVNFGSDYGKGQHHTLYFAVAKDWRVIEKAGDKMLAIERAFGKGAVVLLAESEDFSNEAMVVSDRLELISAVLDSCSRVVFDEQHFGISETGSIVGLARRFRLTGMALGLAIGAALFLWRRAAQFPPPTPAVETDRLAGRTSHAGLLTLLRRHVPASELAAACWREWLSANRRSAPPERLRRAEAAALGGAGSPVEAFQKAQQIISAKGAL